MARLYLPDAEQMRIAEAVQTGNRASMNDAAGLFASYFIYKWIFAITTPASLFSAIAIGHMLNGYWGWGSLIVQQILCVTYTKTGILFTVLMVLLAGGLAAGP